MAEENVNTPTEALLPSALTISTSALVPRIAASIPILSHILSATEPIPSKATSSVVIPSTSAVFASAFALIPSLPAEIPGTTPASVNCTSSLAASITAPSTGISELCASVQLKETNADDTETFQCDKCDYSSNKKQYLKQHSELVHTNERPFKCPFCDYAGKRQQSLKEHLIVHSSDKPYECARCNATFRKKGHLTKHIQMHSKRTEVKCLFCYDLFVNSTVMAEHVRVEHPEETMFMCEICQATVSTKEEMLQHFALKHKQNVLKCPICAFSCQTEKEMSEHEALNHKKEDELEDNSSDLAIPIPLIIKCSLCGYTTSNTVLLQNHMQTHINTKDTMNDDCIKQSEKARTLYKCNNCNFISSEAHAFVSHMTMHTKVKEDDGEVTLQKVATADSLPKARSKFTVDKVSGRYVCEICGYSCDHQRTIKAHIWKHSGHKDVNYPMFRNGPLSIYESVNPATSESGESGVRSVGSKSATTAINPTTLITPVFTLPVNTQSNVYSFVKINNVGDLVVSADDKLDRDESSRSDEAKISRTKSQILNESASGTADQPNAAMVTRLDAGDSCLNDVLKRFCSTGANVIVENTNVPQISQHLTGLRSQQSSPRICEQMDVNSRKATDKLADESGMDASVDELPGNDSQLGNAQVTQVCDMDVVVEEVVKSQPENAPESENNSGFNNDDPALTLLSLLKQGPNFNPACPNLSKGIASDVAVTSSSDSLSTTNSCKSVEDSATVASVETLSTDKTAETSSIVDTESSESETPKNKAGICSSLLAVIEQLHERSKYDAEVDSEGKASTKPLRRAYKRKIKEVNDDDLTTENIGNIERTEEFEGKYRCKLCHYTNSCISVLKQHMRLHKTKKPFECSLCEFVGDCNESLQDHMIQHCKVRMYQCKVCDSAFSYKSQLRAHMRAHIDRVPFVCKHCTFATSDANVFRDHVYSHFENSPSQNLEKRTPSRKLAPAPKAIRDENNKNAALEISGDENDNADEKEVKCPHCDFTFTSYSGMRLHARIHQEELKPLRCALCEFSAVSNRSLKSHMKRHVNDQRYVQQPLEQYRCNICGYVCHHLPSLKSHMWRHASDRNYSYEFTNEVINKAIDYDSRLDGDKDLIALMANYEDTSVMKIEGDKVEDTSCFVTFLCCQCGFETIDKASLGHHMKIHADIIQRTLEVTTGPPGVDGVKDTPAMPSADCK